MARDQSLVASVEALEGRRLLSAAMVNPGVPMVSPAPAPTPAATAAKGHGVTLELKAGKAFHGYLGDIVGASVPAGFKVSASITWGDGSNPSAGTVSISSTGNIDVSGSHTYATGGRFGISISVTATPAPSGGVRDPIILDVGSIASTAFVTSSGGVTLNEKIGVPFTATVGTFSFIAPATGLHASINWGNGTAPSVGTITSTGVSGIDVINFKVTGSHKYAKAGTYEIVTTVTQQLGPPGSTSPIRLITTIDSTAIVTAANLDLDGSITGHFLPPPPTPVTIGPFDVFTGTGIAGVMGPVSASGRIQLPPILSSGPVTGSLTLTTISTAAAGPSGSVTMSLSAPAEKGGGSIPPFLAYTITAGTGDFAGATGTGTVDFIPSTTSRMFTLVIHSA